MGAVRHLIAVGVLTRAAGNAGLAVCHSECWRRGFCPPEALRGALGAAGLRTSSHSLMVWEEQP